MRRNLFMLFLVAATALLATTGGETLASSAFSLIDRQGDAMEILFDQAEYTLETLSIEGETYTRISAEGGARTTEAGMPDMPSYSRLTLLPNTGAVRLEVLGWDEERIPNVIPEPARAILLDGSQPQFEVNQDVYGERRAYSMSAPATLGEPAVMRDIRVAAVTVRPFEWDAATNELVVRSNIQVRIVADETQPGRNEIAAPRLRSRSFEGLYESILGYERDENAQYQQRSILVVYPNNTAVAGVVENFVDWKRSKGFYIESICTNVCGTSKTNIRNYISDCYDNWENPVEYIVLVGDATGSINIATWTENSSYSGETDHPYTQLDGSDLLPEAFVGRISVETSQELLTYWAKLVHYEIQPYTDETDWYEETLLISDTGTSGISTYITNQHARDLIHSYDPNQNFTEITSYGPSPYTIDNEIEEGKVVTSYRGIGGLNGWDIYDIYGLDNGLKLSNGVIITCDTGSFADYYDDSRTEAWIRCGTPSEPSGGITCIGMATNGTHTPFNNALHGGIFFGLYAQDMPTMGEALMRGKLNLYETYFDWWVDYTQRFTYWCNLMGDPSLDVWKMEPQSLNVDCVSTLEEGANYIDVHVANENQAPVKEAWVTVRQKDANDNEIRFATGYTNGSGDIRLMFDSPEQGELNIVVTKPQYIPEFVDVTVSGASIGFDDDMTIADNGDNDGCADAGESVTLTIPLHNFSGSAISSVTAELTSDDSYFTIIAGEDTYGVINGGGDASGSGYVADIAPDCPDNHVIECELVISSGANEWTRAIDITVQGVDIDVTDWVVNDGNNNALDPGETVTLQLELSNNGQVDLSGVQVELRSTDGMTVVADSTAVIGDIAAGALAWNATDMLQLTGLPSLVPGMTVSFKLMLTGANGYEEIEIFELPVGVPTINDPLGPDAGGYFCYDDGDTNYDDCPVYDWIEIDPDYGGSGSDTGLVDNGENYDAVCQEDLPFAFTFYGQTYDMVSICSNGWISFLDTDQASFRNHPVPGPMGPRAMIAAFWDDLTTYGNNNGVYSWYDASSHIFVIEWSRLRNRYNDYSEETFEIILYDPVYYPTTNGNGKIKIQYKEFNNVNQGYQGSYVPEHGLFCTVGLEDHTGFVGLQYTYNNAYPTAARPISDLSAILFTGGPESTQNTEVQIAGVNLNGGSDLTVPYNSSASITFSLQNIGAVTATNVVGTLSCDSPYTDVTAGSGSWDDVTLGQVVWCDDTMSFDVSVWCPDEEVLPLQLDISCDQGNWSFPINLTCHAPLLDIAVDEVDEGDDGVLTPGETAQIYVSVANIGHLNAYQLDASLTTNCSWVTIDNGSLSINSLEAGEELTLTDPFSFTISSAAPTPASFWLDLGLEEEYGVYTLEQVELNTGFHNDVEHADAGWSHALLGGYYDEWHISEERSYSSSHSWHLGQYNGSYHEDQHSALETPEIELTDGAWLTFHHWMQAEDSNSYPGYAYDGGFVEIYYNGLWSEITPVGGYPLLSRGNSSPFADDTPLWSGQIEWTREWFDLSGYSGTVRFRFVFGSDHGTCMEGWYIDDISITTSEGLLEPPQELVAESLPNDIVELEWDAPSMACQSYNVYRRSRLDQPFTLVTNVTQTNYTDDDAFALVQYYVVTAVYAQGESRYSNSAQGETTVVGVNETDIPAVTSLTGNYPNPFNPETTITFSMAEPAKVRLAVYNVRGQRVRTLVNERRESGKHEIVWNGRDDSGAVCASGLYLYRLETGRVTQTRKMLLLK